jgi:hypothetical protein
MLWKNKNKSILVQPQAKTSAPVVEFWSTIHVNNKSTP